MEPNASNKPKTLGRTLNTALISWENTFSNPSAGTKFVLQIENDFREWKNVYWGSKTQFLVDNLAPCSCYNFRLKAISEQEKEESTWVNFKSGTDAIPYYVIHFTRAVKFGKIPAIRKMVNKSPTLLERENKEGKTPLIQAVESKNLQMVTFLVNLGANVNAATLISNFLIDKGANLQATDCNLLTGLHHAVDSGFLKNVELCLNHYLDINIKDNKGWTPLLRAVILNCSDEIIALLLKNGADPLAKDNYGFDFYKHIELENRTYLKKFVITDDSGQKDEGLNTKEIAVMTDVEDDSKKS